MNLTNVAFFQEDLYRIYESAIENNYLKQFNNIIDEKDSRLINDDDLVIIVQVVKEKEEQVYQEL